MVNGKKEKDGSSSINDRNDNNNKKTTRRCYKLSTKIKLVEEYRSHHPAIPMSQWLQKLNVSSEGNCVLPYSTFKKWVNNYDDMVAKADKFNECKGKLEKKKLRVRPYSDMESILAEYLRLRNIRLRSEGKPISSMNFIRAKAKEFYADLYGEEKAQLFKASSGWACRFKKYFRSILKPPMYQRVYALAENEYDDDDDDDDGHEDDDNDDEEEEEDEENDNSDDQEEKDKSCASESLDKPSEKWTSV